jgi:hypothetical protein
MAEWSEATNRRFGVIKPPPPYIYGFIPSPEWGGFGPSGNITVRQVWGFLVYLVDEGTRK